MNSAFFIYELEQLLSGKFLALPDDPGDLGILDVDLVIDSAFAIKLKANRRSPNFDVPIPHRGQTERLVGLCIFVVSHPNQGCFEELDYRRQYFFTR